MPLYRYPQTREGDRAERLHEYGITGAEETEWRTDFASSNVAAFRWIPDDPYPLQVRFLNGMTYGYVAGQSIFEEMVAAPSKGKFVYHVLKRGGYPYRLLA
jgi:KTSC domain